MKRRSAIVVVALGVSLAIVGFVGLPKLLSQSPTSAQVGFAQFEEAALASCLCRREGQSDMECEQILDDARTALFERVGSRLVDVGPMSACAPISVESECYEFSDGLHCVESYNVIANLGDIQISEVCTVAEARAIEEAERLGWVGDDGERPDGSNQAEWDAANARSAQAVQEVMAKILAGEPLEPSQPGNGCAG